MKTQMKIYETLLRPLRICRKYHLWEASKHHESEQHSPNPFAETIVVDTPSIPGLKQWIEAPSDLLMSRDVGREALHIEIPEL